MELETGKLTDKSKQVLDILNGLTVSEIQTVLNIVKQLAERESILDSASIKI